MFACPTHHRLLDHTCPACGTSVRRRTTEHTRLLQLAGHGGLHPAQCRAPIPGPGGSRRVGVCGHRLDTPTSTGFCLDSGTHQELLSFQRRLLGYLRPDGPHTVVSVGQETLSQHYFVDLRILACLITASWPAAREHMTEQQALLLDTHVREARRQIQTVRHSGRAVREISFYDRPPLHAATCASLLALADDITTTEDPDTARDLLHPLLNAAPATRPWIRQFLAGDGYCSPGLQTALGLEIGTLHVIRRTGIRPRVPTPPPRPIHFGIQHIPQHLLPEWHEEFFANSLTAVKPRLLRRAAAARLAQMCAGGSPASAAQLLGIPREATLNAINSVDHSLPRRARRAFDSGLETLAARLDTATDLTDYGKRRHALQTWSLSPEKWEELTADLAQQHHHGGPDWGDGKRALASVWIWVRVTRGEHIFAPPIRPNPDQPRPGGVLPHYVNTRWQFINTRPSGHYNALRERLESYADALTISIDRHASDPSRQHLVPQY